MYPKIYIFGKIREISWGTATPSINTYDQCVYFFEGPGCDSTKKRFRLDIEESSDHWDITDLKPVGGFQSIELCEKDDIGFASGGCKMPINLATIGIIIISKYTVYLFDAYGSSI